MIGLVLSLVVTAHAQQYFPKHALGSSHVEDQLKQNWYSSQLRALQEPSIFALKSMPRAECYRFLWLRTFHHPVAIRLEPKPDGTSVLTVKTADGAGGFRPGVLTENTSKILSREQTQLFLDRLKNLNFWSAPNPVRDQGGTDGSQWIIEGVKNGRYHIADRWSPAKGAVYELGMFLVFDLAQMDIPKNDIY